MWDNKRREFTTVTTSRESEEELTKRDGRIRRDGDANHWPKNRAMSFEEQVDELRTQGEMRSVEVFVQSKMDDECSTYTAMELQALTRNADYATRRIWEALPPQSVVTRIKGELASYGLALEIRQDVKHVRGAMSNAHGVCPHAGFGGGGTGMGTDKDGPIGFGIGGGPGVIGGGYKWDKNDSRNLKMC